MPHAEPWLERAPLLLRDAVNALLPAPARWWVDSFLDIAVLLGVFGLLFAFLTLAERKVLGRIQNRPGPNRAGWGGVLQPIADGIKMLTKEDIVPRLADRGVIVADNVLWRGHVARADVPASEQARTEILRRFNASLVRHPALRGLILPLGDGVAYAVKV